MVRASWESCTCGDDNLCATAKAFIHSKLLVYCPVLRHRLPPKSRASVHSHKYVHPARTGLPLKPRRIFTRPKNVHGAPEGGCLNERRDGEVMPPPIGGCHPVRRLARVMASS